MSSRIPHGVYSIDAFQSDQQDYGKLKTTASHFLKTWPRKNTAFGKKLHIAARLSVYSALTTKALYPVNNFTCGIRYGLGSHVFQSDRPDLCEAFLSFHRLSLSMKVQYRLRFHGLSSCNSSNHRATNNTNSMAIYRRPDRRCLQLILQR